MGKDKLIIKPKKTTAIVAQERANLPALNQADALIAQAINKNVPVETMEKLLIMRKDLKAEWAEEQFNKAMSKLQGELPIIEKDTAVKNKPEKGGGLRYKYATLDKIVKQTSSIISANGFSYLIKVVTEKDDVKVIVKATHVDGHKEETEFKVPIDPTAFMTKQQKYASALTYAKRYAFCNAFGIMTGEEDDDSCTNEVAEKKKAFNKPAHKTPAISKEQVSEKPAISPKEQIMIELKKLGNEPKTKPEVEELVKSFTTLELKPENFEEIISRLSVLVKEIAKSNETRKEEVVVEGVVVAPTPLKKEVSGEKISVAKLTVVRALAKTNCALFDDSEIKQFFQISVDNLEDLSTEEGETLFKKLTTAR